VCVCVCVCVCSRRSISRFSLFEIIPIQRVIAVLFITHVVDAARVGVL
jgi:hypothetical protein